MTSILGMPLACRRWCYGHMHMNNLVSQGKGFHLVGVVIMMVSKWWDQLSTKNIWWTSKDPSSMLCCTHHPPEIQLVWHRWCVAPKTNPLNQSQTKLCKSQVWTRSTMKLRVFFGFLLESIPSEFTQQKYQRPSKEVPTHEHTNISLTCNFFLLSNFPLRIGGCILSLFSRYVPYYYYFNYFSEVSHQVKQLRLKVDCSGVKKVY